MNPSTAKTYKKLIQTCKHFFSTNPILVVERLMMLTEQDLREQHLWNIYDKHIDLSNVSHKFWVTVKFYNYYSDPVSNFVSSVISRFYQCSAKYLFLRKQILTFKEFLFLSSNVEDITLNCTTIKNEDDTVIAFEEIVKVIPKAKHIDIQDNIPYKVTSKTMKELLKIPHFPKIYEISFYGITDDFDITTFCKYMKVNKYTRFRIDFSPPLSNAYIFRLNKIIDEAIGTKNHDFKVPCFYFPGCNMQNYWKMQSLYYQR
uniref:DUF38 domain-containing protein n=1 Tax=Panagrolaimus davidi TaxID=227884 RepID=A0A914PK50_9BILA